MTHGAQLFRWLQRDAVSAPEGAGRALHGYARLIRNGGNLKETAKSTGGLDKAAPGISGTPGPAAREKTFAVGLRQGHSMEKIQMFPGPGREWK